MPDRLQSALQSLLEMQNPEVRALGATAFLLILAISLISGILVAALYRRFYGREQTGSEIHRAFPLLAITITAIFICIQFSLPLSLGLLGALSIVRFRTPIKEPQEIGFLMVVIASSLACATFNFTFLAMILGMTLLALVALEYLPAALLGGRGGGLVMISLSGDEFGRKREELFGLLRSAVPKGRIESLSEEANEVVLVYSFRSLSAESAAELRERLGAASESLRLTVSYERGETL